MNHPNNIFPGDLVFIQCHHWDVYFDRSNVGRVYEEDRVPEGLAVIVLDKRPRMEDENVPCHIPVFVVTTGFKTFWMVSK